MNSINNSYSDLVYLFGFFLIIILSYFSIYINQKFKIFSLDKKTGIQKVHVTDSLRLGGGLIVFSSIISIYFFSFNPKIFFLLAVCLSPVFIAGLLEDLTLNVSIETRFFASLISALLFVIILDVRLDNVDIFWINYLLSIEFIGIFSTIMGLTIICHAWNFIDGLNGIASGIGMVCFFTLSYLAFLSGKIHLIEPLIFLGSVCTGFWLVNILTGKIFLGDSGAYIIGILIGWAGLEVSTGTQAISPWAVFLIIALPAAEIIISPLRRLYIKKSPTRPDNLHLHSLIYRSILNLGTFKNKIFINSFSGLIVTIIGCVPISLCFIFEAKFPYVFWSVIGFFILYLILFSFFLYIIRINNNTFSNL